MYGEWLHVRSCMAKDPIYDDEYKNQKPVMENAVAQLPLFRR